MNALYALALLACAAGDPPPLTVVIMDPLAAPLSCPCVQGYAQRDYDQLGKFLEKQLGRPVKVEYSESLAVAVKKKTAGKADLVIGKFSVIAADAKKLDRGFTPVLALSGKDGQTVQTGLIVVPTPDAAQSVADLKGYKIMFGPADCAEKHDAAIDLLKTHNIAIPAKPECCEGCDVGAQKVLDLYPKEKAAAVISSYAHPLLEGCATVPKGSLRIIGTTAPVPFVTAYLSDALSPSDKAAITTALRQVSDHPKLLVALESKAGFVARDDDSKKK